MKTIIHVNQHVIKSNEKHDQDEHPITVKTYKKNTRGSDVEIVVAGVVVARIKYRRKKPLKCGARVWIETQHEVRVKGGS